MIFPTRLVVLAFLLLLVLTLIYSSQLSHNVNATGKWRGQDLFHVPVAWCVLDGSPSSAANNTDEKLQNREYLASAYVYMDQAGTDFHSAVESKSNLGTHHFPHIKDTDLTIGVMGDVLDPTLDHREFDTTFNNCKDAWNKIGGQQGVLAVNINHFVDRAGRQSPMTAIGGCDYSLWSLVTSSCQDGHIMVVDNDYTGNDSIGWFTSHSLGHALGLSNRQNSDAIMNAWPIYDRSGIPSNLELNYNEATSARHNANGISGLSIDPPGKITRGDIVETNKVVPSNESKIPPYLDLSEVKIGMNTTAKTISFGQQVSGLIRNDTQHPLNYFTLVDTDNNNNTGGSRKLLEEIGVPLTNFTGAELIIQAQIKPQEKKITDSVWQFRAGKFVMLPPDKSKSNLERLVVYPTYRSNTRSQLLSPVPIHDTISVTVNNNELANPIFLDKPFSVQMITTESGNPIIYKLNTKTGEGRTSEFVLRYPSLPECLPLSSNSSVGKSVRLEIQNFPPNSEVHGYLGLKPIFSGMTDGRGIGAIEFQPPKNASKGLTLISTAADDTAISANCIVNVNAANTGTITRLTAANTTDRTQESNTAPIATNQNIATSKSTPVDISLSASDVDAGNAIIFSIVSRPLHGALTNFHPDLGTVTYLPINKFTGDDSFTFKANDGKVDSNTATVSIRVTDKKMILSQTPLGNNPNPSPQDGNSPDNNSPGKKTDKNPPDGTPEVPP